MLWKELKRRVDSTARHSKRLIKALKKVAPFIPEETANDLYILVPSRRTMGTVFTFSGTIMYLRLPQRGESQQETDFTVAHEFAHVLLKHPQTGFPAGKRAERQANKLARSWGFHSRYANSQY